jgi:hypothetical protein
MEDVLKGLPKVSAVQFEKDLLPLSPPEEKG